MTQINVPFNMPTRKNTLVHIYNHAIPLIYPSATNRSILQQFLNIFTNPKEFGQKNGC